MENKQVTEFTLEDGSVYQVLSQEEYEGHLYVYLFSADNGEDIMIQEYKNDELLGVPEEITMKLIELFQRKHKNLRN